ncbi:glycosyltransferase [Salinicola halophilus]|uniref:glycosyltransferase n=1 Tax=Salinicola halophilus TaxID=184065 RepID=UPI000DA15E1C|nr:glycosyltransferase [Salinicola halophilus]
MSHYAVVAPALYSHFHALQALAGALIARGHRVTFVHQIDARTLITDARVEFEPVGGDTHPAGALSRTHRLAASPSGLSIRRLIADMAATTDMLCRALPAALARLDVDGVIADQMEAAGGLVAEGLNLPFVSVACALPVEREPGLPLPVMPFRYATDERALKRYAASETVYDRLMRPHARVIAAHAEAFGLAPRHALHECLSPLARLSQTPAALDFPRRDWPPHAHAVGPLRAADRDRPTSTEPAWPLDPARPLVFASLGTLQGHRYRLFARIAKACRRLDVALVIAHCGGLTPEQATRLERLGATFVTDFADQRATLAQADAVVTHGGLNTVIDAIAADTPILVIPLAFDQPGVAARVAYHGIGERLSRFASHRRIARTLATLLDAPACLDVSNGRQRMAALRHSLEDAGGAAYAATLVERAIATGRPQTNDTPRPEEATMTPARVPSRPAADRTNVAAEPAP